MYFGIFLLACMTGCATSYPGIHPESATGIQEVTLDIRVPSSERADVDLASIPGAFFGTPSKDVIVHTWVGDGRSLRLDMPFIAKRAWPQAEPAGERVGTHAPRVYPEDARFARMGTKQMPSVKGRGVSNSGSFMDGEGHAYILVYVDRAARMKGDISSDSDTAFHADLEFPGAGMYWIRSIPSTDGNTTRLVNADEDIDGLKFIITEVRWEEGKGWVKAQEESGTN